MPEVLLVANTKLIHKVNRKDNYVFANVLPSLFYIVTKIMLFPVYRRTFINRCGVAYYIYIYIYILKHDLWLHRPYKLFANYPIYKHSTSSARDDPDITSVHAIACTSQSGAAKALHNASFKTSKILVHKIHFFRNYFVDNLSFLCFRNRFITVLVRFLAELFSLNFYII